VLHHISSAPLSPHFSGSAFSNPTSFFFSAPLSPHTFFFWVRLWALTSQVVYFLTLPPFECTFEPSLTFFWVGHPLQLDHSPCFYLGRPPVTMRPFRHLGRSPITTQPLYLFHFSIGHSLQLDHSPCFFLG
jgi:hypothetical protein